MIRRNLCLGCGNNCLTLNSLYCSWFALTTNRWLLYQDISWFLATSTITTADNNELWSALLNDLVDLAWGSSSHNLFATLYNLSDTLGSPHNLSHLLALDQGQLGDVASCYNLSYTSFTRA